MNLQQIIGIVQLMQNSPTPEYRHAAGLMLNILQDDRKSVAQLQKELYDLRMQIMERMQGSLDEETRNYLRRVYALMINTGQRIETLMLEEHYASGRLTGE